MGRRRRQRACCLEPGADLLQLDGPLTAGGLKFRQKALAHSGARPKKPDRHFQRSGQFQPRLAQLGAEADLEILECHA